MPPTIELDLPTQIQLMEGDDYSLPCSARGIPDPAISWRRDGQSIVGHKDGKRIKYSKFFTAENIGNVLHNIYQTRLCHEIAQLIM